MYFHFKGALRFERLQRQTKREYRHSTLNTGPSPPETVSEANLREGEVLALVLPPPVYLGVLASLAQSVGEVHPVFRVK